MEQTPYPSDLTDEQWKLIEPFIPPAKHGGRPLTVSMQEVLNAILYLIPIVQNRCACSSFRAKRSRVEKSDL